LFAADEQQLALLSRAQSDFDRVELSGSPQLRDAAECVQSQAALLAVAPKTETSLLRFRKGYCTLAGATVTGSAEEFREAAAEFERAIAGWPDRTSRNRNLPPEPVPSGLRILTQAAKLNAGTDSTLKEQARQEIRAAVQSPTCSANLMPANLCESLVGVGKDWLGWMALEQDDLIEAAQSFNGTSGSAWIRWTTGLRVFRDRKYADAVKEYRQAVESWTTRVSPGSLVSRIEPQPAMPEMWAQLGSAQLLAGDPLAAIASFDRAIKADSMLAGAIYLRGRARELAGQTDQALADYSLASRTAFANAQDLASGEAHLYRGIFMYRRKNYSQAEDEFASALNFDIPDKLRPDASAWRRLAAVAAGSCGATRSELEESLVRVSPYFPKDEARKVAASCKVTGAAITNSAVR
jgi:tetratricopeptide (TPR) repeat protein